MTKPKSRRLPPTLGDEVPYPELWEAGPEENEQNILNLAETHKRDFVKLGVLLLANKNRAYWAKNMHGSFKDFCEELGLGSYSRMTRLADMARLLIDGTLEEATISEIGFSKMCLLLPGFKRGEVSDDLIELAKTCPYSDLRDELGYAAQLQIGQRDTYICPRCGEEFTIDPARVKKAKRGREATNGDNQEQGAEAGEVAGQEH